MTLDEKISSSSSSANALEKSVFSLPGRHVLFTLTKKDESEEILQKTT
jgi:hypothetical protein